MVRLPKEGGEAPKKRGRPPLSKTRDAKAEQERSALLPEAAADTGAASAAAVPAAPEPKAPRPRGRPRKVVPAEPETRPLPEPPAICSGYYGYKNDRK